MEASMARSGTETTTRVTVLENQVEAISSNVVKLEQKIDANYATLHSRISDLRDDLRSDIDTKHERLVEKIDHNAKSSASQHQQLYDKLSSIEKWRWFITGGAIVMGYVIAHIKLENLF